jgi:site-specific DNA-methyltransferase (adenine-specific)
MSEKFHSLLESVGYPRRCDNDPGHLAANTRRACALCLAPDQRIEHPEPFINRILCGDCLDILKRIPDRTADLVVTDPPYLVNYKPRDGRTFANDASADWVRPAFAQLYRVLKPDRFCVSFYGWTHIEEFMLAWKGAGFRPVGHLVFKKEYPSRKGYLAGFHELAYLLAKGRPEPPDETLPDVLPWKYTGNRLHPTQKPIEAIEPLIGAFSAPGDIVLDPFCGSGTVALAAKNANRRYIAIEKDPGYHRAAIERLAAG